MTQHVQLQELDLSREAIQQEDGIPEIPLGIPDASQNELVIVTARSL